MREYNIKVEPYDFIDFLELEIHKKVNEHVTAKIKGHIKEENINKYINLNSSHQWVTISAVGENNEVKILFKGIIKNIKESTYSGLSTLSIEAVSGSYLSDISSKIRTFQDGSQTYNDVIDRIKTEENQFCTSDTKLNINQMEGLGKSINEFIVQYNETNWQFLKRLASHWNSYLVPEYKQSGCKINFGRPEIGTVAIIKNYDYIMEKNIAEYRYKSENKIQGYSESDTICFKVETREIYDLCEQINFKDRELYIVEINTKLKKGELLHTYKLQSAKGSKVPKYYNFKIIGASLEANIKEVEKDNVKVEIKVDNGKTKSVNRWYPYSTVYSSPDGTGWYFMPEKGDSVRVYFPNEKENDAFIISSVHEEISSSNSSMSMNPGTSGSCLSSSNQAPRSNPDSKSLSTKFGKQINFNPGNIEIISGDNLFITITDGEGIAIKSDAAITLEAEEDIVVSSGKNLLLTAGTGITMAKGSEEGDEQGKIEISEDKEITLTGKDIKMNF